MTETMDHETCSQLLRAYIAGEAGDDEPAVAAHLEGCPQCRAERAGLQALMTPVESLTPGERTRLRDTVADATHPASPQLHAVPGSTTSPGPRPGATAPPTRRSKARWDRFAPALSAAAVLLLIASAIVLFQHLGGSSGGPSAASGAKPAAPGARNGPATHRSDLIEGIHPSLPLPRFAATAVATIDRAEAQAGSLLPAYAAAYSGTHATRLAPEFLNRLAQSAPTTVASQVRECGSRVLAEPGMVGVPAYGATTTVGGRAALVLVFAARGSTGAALTRLELRAWPLGSCDRELVHRSAPLAR